MERETAPQYPTLRTPEEYEALLNDPERPLPVTHLVLEEKRRRDRYSNPSPYTGRIFEDREIFTITDAVGKKVGELETFYVVDVHNPVAPTVIDIGWIETDQGRRPGGKGQGYGRSAMLEAIKRYAAQGIRVRSGSSISIKAKPLWDWLVDKKIAYVVKDYGINPDFEYDPNDPMDDGLEYTFSVYETI